MGDIISITELRSARSATKQPKPQPSPAKLSVIEQLSLSLAFLLNWKRTASMTNGATRFSPTAKGSKVNSLTSPEYKKFLKDYSTFSYDE